MRKTSSLLYAVLMVASSSAQVRFTDDFESDISNWEVNDMQSVRIVDSGDSHGKVLSLIPNGNVIVLIKESDQWGAIKVEGEMNFPDNVHNYLGFIFNYNRRARREDFGVLYLKGNSSYIRANPFRDGNVSRLLYEEFRTNLRDENRIQIGKWHKFKMEVEAEVCHLYIDDMKIPKITFDLFEFKSGKVGFQPRPTGGEVRIDNIKVSSIKSLSYKGVPIPNPDYKPDELLSSWEVMGPFKRPRKEIENHFPKELGQGIEIDGKIRTWEPFFGDKRGAIVTGKVTEFEGENSVAYFRIPIQVKESTQFTIHFSTIDELTLYLNGRILRRVYRDGYVSRENDWNAWYDFWENPEHAGRKISVNVKEGLNFLVVKVRNGQFASGGFFAYREK